MSLLSTINGPHDVRKLAPEQLAGLAAEIRDFLVQAVARTGGHLGPNLGAVELTIAIHRVFDSPLRPHRLGHRPPGVRAQDPYRAGRTASTGCASAAGCPATRAGPSPSTTSSRTRTPPRRSPTPTGWPRAYALRGENRAVVAVVGDGALTGGMCWEALNNIAAAKDRPVVIVVNDNGRSYAPTIGGLADHLASLRLAPEYEQVLDVVKQVLGRTPLVGTADATRRCTGSRRASRTSSSRRACSRTSA